MTAVLRTPIETFHHQDTGSQVDLVGAIHVADRRYYGTLQTFLDDRTMRGACVQCEGTTAPTMDELRAASPALMARWTTFEDYHNQKERVYKNAGFALQMEALEYQPSWLNRDVPTLDVVRSIDSAKFDKMAEKARAYERLGKLSVREQRIVLLELFARMAKEAENPTAEGDDYILAGRNAVALNAMDAQERAHPGSDFTMFWGAGHLPGLRKGLWARKYKMTSRKLVTAVRY